MSSDAGKINENKRENEDFVMDENLINMGLKPKINGNGPEVTQLKPNKRRWKYQARAQREKSANIQRILLAKRF